MNIKYILLALVLILVTAGIFLLPDRKDYKELKPEELLAAANSHSRFLSTDLVASRLIDGDPSLYLVDVRSMYDYEDYSLPYAMSIPLEEEYFIPDWQDYLDQEGKDIVLFSNGDILADQAWMMLKRAGKQNIFVMKGGLNCWFRTIMQPVPPPATAPTEAIDLYQFRKGAAQFFLGGSLPLDEPVEQEAIKVKRKKKKAVAEGGC